MTSRARLWLCLAMVTALHVLHVHLKTAKIFANPTWDARDETGQFWSEAAFQYRFAKYFAEHPLRDWGELAHDRDVQHPDTIDDWAEFTVAMEVPVGVLYRWLKPATPFHVFVVWYDCLVSSLSLFAVFFLARALWRSDAVGVFASAFYATLYPSYGRTVKNLFLREDFAIPWIIFALFFTVRALQEQKTRDQILAAVFWLTALASWHLTQFVMAPFIVAAVLVYLGKGETPRLPWLVLVLAAGTLLIPVLRAKQVYLSPTMCALYALALAVWINGGRKKATIVFACWLAAFLVAGAWFQKTYGEYAHVYELFFYKLRFFGVKPDAPTALPWEARVLWEGAFDTADAKEFWHSLAWCGPLSLAGVVAALCEYRPRPNPDDGGHRLPLQIFALFTLLLFPLSWMVVRYFTFLGFAASVLVAGLVARRIWWRLAVLVAVVWQFATLDLKPLERIQPEPREYRAVVDWIRENTPSNAVILATITESPVLWAHTSRPIILHSKFENWTIRERYREFLRAIYSNEAQFHQFCATDGADYFVYDIGFMLDAKESRRYKADELGLLDPNCAAMLFQEHPERLKLFEPEFAEARFAVFRVLR